MLIKQLFWILLFSLLGDLLSFLLASVVAIPGSVLGMVLLFLALHYNVVQVEQVEKVGTWLTDNMAIFFVPAGVGLMTNFSILKSTWWQLLVVVLVTVAVLLLVVGRLVQFIKSKRKI
ncbi:CidA/LrgA family protein [Aerococcus urinae]